jgi:hypothetical protein
VDICEQAIRSRFATFVRKLMRFCGEPIIGEFLHFSAIIGFENEHGTLWITHGTL